MSAPKGNQFAIGLQGTEKMFSSPEELKERINKYFEDCDNNIKVLLIKKGVVVESRPDPIPYTVEGLARVLGCDRNTLLLYEKKAGYEDYFSIIKEAKLRMEEQKVIRGLKGESNATFAIFDLVNNTDYRNTSSIDVNKKNTSVILNQELSDEQIDKLIDKL